MASWDDHMLGDVDRSDEVVPTDLARSAKAGDRRFLRQAAMGGHAPAPRLLRRHCWPARKAPEARGRGEQQDRPRSTSTTCADGLHRRHNKGRPSFTRLMHKCHEATTPGTDVRASRHSRSRRVRGAHSLDRRSAALRPEVTSNTNGEYCTWEYVDSSECGQTSTW
jgi:hypothetical protein